MTVQESATHRLSRLLTMVPWLLRRQGVDIEEAAAEFGVSRAQIEADLELLFVCGTPGHLPDDLIEAEWEDGRVFLSNADTIDRPLRLGVDEAIALIVGLRALAQVPGIGSRDAVARALAKLEVATGGLAGAASQIQVAIDEGDVAETLTQAQVALATHRRVHLRYLVAGRDEATERDVDPMRVLNIDARWYLEGWCHRAEDVRLFRLDRIERLDILDVDGAPPADARPRDLTNGFFSAGEAGQVAVVHLLPGSTWVSDYYPTETIEEHADGSQVVSFRTSDSAWLRRLLMRLGGRAVVLEPTALALEVSVATQAALAQYGV